MNRNEFLSGLEACLTALPQEEREAALTFYREYFDEAGVENEAQVLTELGDPANVARLILGEEAEIPPQNEQQQASEPAQNPPLPPLYDKPKRSAGMTALLIILAVFASPVWLSIAAALLGVLITVFAVVVAAVIALFAVVVALAFAGIAALIAAIATLVSDPLTGLVILGMSLASIGCGMLFTVPLIILIRRGFPAMGRWFRLRILRKKPQEQMQTVQPDVSGEDYPQEGGDPA